MHGIKQFRYVWSYAFLDEAQNGDKHKVVHYSKTDLTDLQQESRDER